MTSFCVIQEHDDGHDEVLASGFSSEAQAWDWASDYSLYYSKRWRRYAFLRVKQDPDGKAHPPPRIPKRPWWRRFSSG